MAEVPEVSIIIPARNEQANIPACLASLINQPGVRCEIFVVDDNSEDNTRVEVSRFPQVKLLSAPTLPPDWTGKAFAICQAIPHAKGKWLLFTDADTQHAPGSLQKALTEAQQNNLVLLSYSPKQKVVTFWEKILQPIVFAELNRNFRYEEVSDASSDVAAANGQYLLVRRDAYERAGGHVAIKGSLLDDVDLARRLKRQGFIRFRYSPESVEARMYTTFAEIAAGWTKNLAALFPDAIYIAVKRALQGLLIVVLLAACVLLFHLGKKTEAVLSLAALAMLWGFHIRSAHAAGYSISTSIVSVVGLFLFSYLLFRSRWLYRHGGVTWKGRIYHVKDASGREVSH